MTVVGAGGTATLVASSSPEEEEAGEWAMGAEADGEANGLKRSDRSVTDTM
jgi:hypothetical protein